MKVYGQAARGSGDIESIPVPRAPLGKHFPKPPKPVSTSPFPPLSEEEAKAPLVPSATYAASTVSKRAAKPRRPRMDEARARALLASDMPRIQVAKELGISPETLRRFARANGYPVKRATSRHPSTKETPEGLIQDALNGMNSAQLEAKYHMCRRTVIKHLNRAGYEYTRNGLHPLDEKERQ